MRRLIFCLAFVFVLLAGIVAADEIPGIPHRFYGTATVNGELVNSNILTAIIGLDSYSTVIINGSYGFGHIFYIEDPDANRDGETVTFYLGGENGKEVGTFTFVNNGKTQFDIDTTTSCGDGFCIGDETCTSCEIDCGICTDPPVITIDSPLSGTIYDTDKIDLIVSSNQEIIMWMYSLNGDTPETFEPNIIITGTYNSTTGKGNNSVTVIGINKQFQSGTATTDFTIELDPSYCGDGICNGNEGCSTCSGDCGSCEGNGGSDGSSGSGVSGGSGGVSSASSDNDEPETLVYSSLESGDDEGSQKEQGSSNDLIGSSDDVEPNGFFSSITGAVTGVAGGTIGVIVIAFILLIVVLLIIVKIKKK